MQPTFSGTRNGILSSRTSAGDLLSPCAIHSNEKSDFQEPF
jgi:hypothetical protein